MTLPARTGPSKPPSTAERERAAASSASPPAAASRSADSDDDDDAAEEGLKHLNLKRVIMQDAMERKAEAAEAAATARAGKKTDERGDAAAMDDAETAATTVAGTREILAGAPDVVGAPLLPAQLDEDNEMFYCPRLTTANLQRITGESDLKRVTTLALHLNTEEQDLADLSNFLPALQNLALIPPSFVSSFRDFGRSLRCIESLSLPRCCLVDLDGIDALECLIDLCVPANQIADLSPLMFAPRSLRHLDLRDNLVEEADMIEFIGCNSGNLAQLNSLDMEGNPISMRKAYRNIVGSRCKDMEVGRLRLDGAPITAAEQERFSESAESAVDREKSRAFKAKLERGELAHAYSHPGGGGGQKLALAKAQQLSAASSSSSSSNDLGSVKPRSRDAAGYPASLAASAGSGGLVSPPVPLVPSSATSAAALAARRREFESFLNSKESAAGVAVGSGASAAADARRKKEKQTAVADIMRAMQDEDGPAGSGSSSGGGSAGAANAYAQRLLEAKQAKLAAAGGSPATAATAAPSVSVPRLSFDASYNANSPSSWPIGAGPTNPFAASASSVARPGSASGGRPVTATAALSLSTPRGNRPSSASGVRPGTASGVRDSPDLDDHPSGPSDASSDLTYGSAAVMAGGFAQAMRARKKKDSISFSSGMGGTGGVDDNGGSRSPSSNSASNSRAVSASATHNKYSRSASPAPPAAAAVVARPTSSSSSNGAPSASSTAADSNKPLIVFKAKTAAAAGAIPTGSPSHGAAASPAAVPSPLLSPSARPVVAGAAAGGGGGSMLARHLASAAPANAQPAHASEVVFTIPGSKSATAGGATAVPVGAASASRSSAGKTYTLVRNPAKPAQK